MKVMFLIPHIADGGAEKILSELSRNLKAAEVVLVVFEQKIGYPFEGRLMSLDMPIHRGSLLRRLLGLVRRSYQFRRILRQEHPDTVVSFMGEANVLNTLLSPRPIVTVHNHLSSLAELRRAAAGSKVARMRSRLEALASEVLIRALYRRATVVAVSKAVKKEMVDRFHIPEDQVVVIPNAINSREIQEKAAEPVVYPWDTGVPVIITAGRLTLQKGQWHLIRAFAEVRKRMPCQLAILGAGELEGYLRSVAKTVGIERDLYFLGWQANPWKFMAKANLFVLPSLTEGFPLALMEAMACGLPVISTDCPGASRDILAAETTDEPVVNQPEYAEYGVLVPVFDYSLHNNHDHCTTAELQLAEAVVCILRNPDMWNRYVNAGLTRVRDFDYSVFLERYQRLIEKA